MSAGKVVIIFLIMTMGIGSSIMGAIDGKSKVRSFFGGALVLPVLGALSGLVVFTLDSIPESITNNVDRPVLGPVVILSVFFGGSSLVGLVMFKLIEKLDK